MANVKNVGGGGILTFKDMLALQTVQWHAKCAQVSQAWSSSSGGSAATTTTTIPSPRKRKVEDGQEVGVAKKARVEVADTKKEEEEEPSTSSRPCWTAVGWCARLLERVVQSALTRPSDCKVEVIEAPKRPGGGRRRRRRRRGHVGRYRNRPTWTAIVLEHLCALGGQGTTELAARALKKLEVIQIADNDPRTTLRGQRGVRAGARFERDEFVIMFGGLMTVRDELPTVLGSEHLDAKSFDDYAFDLTCPASNGKLISISGLSPYGNIGGLINDYRGTSSTATPNVGFSELTVSFGDGDALPLIVGYALCGIPKGTELVTDYGNAYWSTRNLYAAHA
jgi:hypothetical protein